MQPMLLLKMGFVQHNKYSAFMKELFVKYQSFFMERNSEQRTDSFLQKIMHKWNSGMQKNNSDVDRDALLLLKRWVPCSLPSEWCRHSYRECRKNMVMNRRPNGQTSFVSEVTLTSECWQTRNLNTIGYFIWAGFVTYLKKNWRRN